MKYFEVLFNNEEFTELVNIIAANGMNQFHELYECHLRVGGLPQSPKNQLKYQLAFSIRGLVNEYLENAIIIHN